LGGSKSGTLGWALASVEHVLNPLDLAAFSQFVSRATDLAFQFEQVARQFFVTLDQFLFEQREGRPVGQYAHQERILSAAPPACLGEVEASGTKRSAACNPC
jgi:hypothetical protein